jgi:hypothetical protein
MRRISTTSYFVPALIFLFFLGFYLFTTKGVIHIADGMVNFQTTRAIVEDGSLAVDCTIIDEFVVQNENGRCYSKYDIGLALTSLPLYLAGRLIAPDPPDMYAVSIPKLFVSMLPQLATAVTCALLYVFALHIGGQETAAFGAALLYGTATLAWPYAGLYFSQPLIGLLLLLAVTLLVKFPPNHHKAQLAAGLALGWACLTRLDTLPLALLVLLYAAYQLWRSHSNIRQWALALLLLGVPIFGALVAYIGMNVVRTGSFWQFGYANEGWTTPFLTGLYGLLLSPGRGLVFYSPLAVLAAVGLWGLWRRGWRAEMLLIASLVAGQIAFYASWWAWEGGVVWGPRFLVSTHALLMVGLLPWLDGSWPKWPVVVTAVPAFFIQFIGMASEAGTYLQTSGYTYQETLFNWVASPILGQFRAILLRDYSFLLVNRAYGLLSTANLLLWLVVCLVLMFVPLWLLRGRFAEPNSTEPGL